MASVFVSRTVISLCFDVVKIPTIASVSMAAAVMARGKSRIAGDADAKGFALTIVSALTMIIADSVNNRAKTIGKFGLNKLHLFN